MLKFVIVTLSVSLWCGALGAPRPYTTEVSERSGPLAPPARHKRFVNPSLPLGYFSDNTFPKIRTKRSLAQCERLRLCKLHASAGRNFLAAFELYFVSKENAKLWDHRQHSLSDCEQRFSGCYQR